MRLFITGGQGMVGRNLCAKARESGHDICAFSRQQLDLLDFQATLAAIRHFQPDVIIHAAGVVGGIQANIAAPYDFCFSNLQIGLNIVRASHAADVEQLINLGSSCMYPRNGDNPLKETSVLTGELEPTNEGYALAKLAVAKLCEYLSQQYGVRYRTLIPCNLYGVWDNFDPHRSHMIPAVIRKIHEAKLAGVSLVDIWGDGNARREFMFTGDLAELVILACQRVEQLPQYMNVGLGHDFSINDYYREIASVIGYQGGFEYDLSKPTGMKQKLVDISKQTDFGWSPSTSLRDGIDITYTHFLKSVI